MNVKKGDTVMIITGNEKGERGVVSKVNPGKNTVIIEDKNLVKKAKKARQANDVSKIIDMAAPLNVSNVMPICGACDSVCRIRHTKEETDKGLKSVRICSKCGASLDSAKNTKAAAKTATKKPAKKATKKAKKED